MAITNCYWVLMGIVVEGHAVALCIEKKNERKEKM